MSFHGSVAPHPLPLPLPYTQDPFLNASHISRGFESLTLHQSPRPSEIPQHIVRLAIEQACRAIEECFTKTRRPPIPSTLHTIVNQTIRHLRRLCHDLNLQTYTKSIVKFDHKINMLRREVVRAIRHERLEFERPDGSRYRLTAKCLRGRKLELASFVNGICYKVTRKLGCFEAPLLPFDVRGHASDEPRVRESDGVEDDGGEESFDAEEEEDGYAGGDSDDIELDDHVEMNFD